MIQTDDALYTDLILDLYRNPPNKGVIKDAEITHSGVNITCGDHMRVYLKLDYGKELSEVLSRGQDTSVASTERKQGFIIKPEAAKSEARRASRETLVSPRIKNATFEGNGCAISIAAASLITEVIKGKMFFEILSLQKEDIFDLLGAPLGPSRVKCGMLCLETIQEGIKLRNL